MKDDIDIIFRNELQILDDGNLQTWQARTQVLGPTGPGAVPVGLPTADGGHPAGCAAPAHGTHVLQVSPPAPRQVRPGRLLRSHLALHGY